MMRQPPLNQRQIRFDVDLPFPVEEVWKYVSNTDRMDRSWRLPIVSYTHNADATGGSKRIGSLKFGPLTVKWLEHPYEWEEGKYFTVRREYFGGPIRVFEIFFWLEQTGPSSTRVHHVIGLDGNPLVVWLVALALKHKSRTDVGRGYDQLRAFLSQQAPSAYVPMNCDRPAFPAAKGKDYEQRLLAAGVSPEVATRLLEHIRCAQEPDLAKMRAFTLAREWKMDRTEVLSGLLRATRAGVLMMSWDLLCPGCRGAKISAESLASVKNGAHCDSCNIDFTVDFDRSVEITFNVHPSLRTIRVATYCVGGPQNTPHVLSQLILGPMRKGRIDIRLGPGRYRVRSPQSKTTLELEVLPVSGELVEVPLALDFGVGKPRGARLLPGTMCLSLTNSHPHEILVVLENMKWMEDATTAAFLTSQQEFRDLFSSEVLAPGQEIAVGAIALMFTDLKGSTAMYGRIGDASAFALVRDHFKILIAAVKRNEGCLVKTIGDAVMGSFTRPEKALRAALEIQAEIAQANAAGGLGRKQREPLTVKIGLHYGPCYVVNLNERLDYFGTAVNIAARTEGQCKGGDVVMTAAMAAIPSVVEVLRESGRSHETFEVCLKGFDQSFSLCRVDCSEPVAQEKVVSIGLGDRVGSVSGTGDGAG